MTPAAIWNNQQDNQQLQFQFYHLSDRKYYKLYIVVFHLIFYSAIIHHIFGCVSVAPFMTELPTNNYVIHNIFQFIKLLEVQML